MSNNDRLVKTAEKLLQVARMRGDEVTGSLAAIRVARESTQTALAQLDHSLLQEQRRVELAVERDREDGNVANPIDPAQLMAAKYADKIRINRANMIATLEQLDEREQALNDDLQLNHAEVKKYERLLEVSDRKNKALQQRREEKENDALIAARYSR